MVLELESGGLINFSKQNVALVFLTCAAFVLLKKILIFAPKNFIMSKSIIDKINYIVALITEFATAHHITTQQAYRYLQQYKGLDFVDKFYDVEHTYSFENTVEDLTAYCQRMGGTLS